MRPFFEAEAGLRLPRCATERFRSPIRPQHFRMIDDAVRSVDFDALISSSGLAVISDRLHSTISMEAAAICHLAAMALSFIAPRQPRRTPLQTPRNRCARLTPTRPLIRGCAAARGASRASAELPMPHRACSLDDSGRAYELF